MNFHFDAMNQKRQSVRQIPLIAMETTILNEKYMNLKHEDALNYILKIKGVCERVGGSFVLSWHNSNLNNESDVRLFNSILD